MPDRRAYEYRKNNIWNHKRWKRSNCLYAAQHSGNACEDQQSRSGNRIRGDERFAGERKDIVLGYDKVSDYEENGTFFGAAVGRGANRTEGAGFVLDGTEYHLPKMRERITCTVDRTVMRSASGIV